MPFIGRNAASVFLGLSEAERGKLIAAQRSDPYGTTGNNGLQMLERIVAAHRTGRLLDKVESAAHALKTPT